MSSSRLLALALVISLGMGSIAGAGNGSNYIHLLNGTDYFFGTSPYSGGAGLRGIWRCFPSERLHSPTRVIDPGSPEVGNYASKVRAVHQTTLSSPFITVAFPNITLSTSDGRCHFLQSGGTAMNFGLATGTGNGYAVVGPLSNQGAAATISGSWSITNVGLTNPYSTMSLLIQTMLTLTHQFGGPSAIPVRDGEALTLWHAEPNQQTVGAQHYWTGSFDERNLCSGNSFLLSGGTLASVSGIGFSPAWEWSTGIGTIDTTMTNVVAVGASGGGPSGMNAHASSTAFAQPFDQGSGTMTVSVTGTGLFNPTTSAGEILGFNTYDENNAFGGSLRVVFTNLWGFTQDGSTHCANAATANPGAITLPTGGPGGPQLSALRTRPRIVARLDAMALALAMNPMWIAATSHRTKKNGSNIPWYPAPAGISGSTGNGAGFAIPLPALPALVGVTIFSSSAALDASGTFIAALANDGHSHSNGSAATFFP